MTIRELLGRTLVNATMVKWDMPIDRYALQDEVARGLAMGALSSPIEPGNSTPFAELDEYDEDSFDAESVAAFNAEARTLLAACSDRDLASTLSFLSPAEFGIHAWLERVYGSGHSKFSGEGNLGKHWLDAAVAARALGPATAVDRNGTLHLVRG